MSGLVTSQASVPSETHKQSDERWIHSSISSSSSSYSSISSSSPASDPAKAAAAS